MTRQRIVFLDRATIGPSVTIKRPAFEHDWIEHQATAKDQVAERLRGATIAITNKVPIDAGTLAGLPDLRLVAVAATGYDLVDVAACRARGVVVANVRGYALHTVPEHTFALILALRRALIGYRQDVIAGDWQRAGQFCFFNHPIRDLDGSTLGIIGEGTIGQEVARLGQAFGMRTLFAAHKGVSGLGPLYTPFDEVLERSDVITPPCPADAEHAQPDRHAGVPKDAAPAAPDQRLARRPGRRGGSGPGAGRGPDRRRRLRLSHRRAAAQ